MNSRIAFVGILTTTILYFSLGAASHGERSSLELEASAPITYVSLKGPVFAVERGQDYVFKGYYASTCKDVATDEKWMNAKRVILHGNWLDGTKTTVGSFTIVLPETQDGWIECFQEARSTRDAEQLQIVITRRVEGGGRLRFADFSLRKGKLRDYKEEFSLRQIPDEDFFPVYAIYPPSGRQGKQGNCNSDRHHAKYALANFNLGLGSEHKKNLEGFGVRYYREGGPPKDDAVLSAMAKDPNLMYFFGVDEPQEKAFPGLAELNERVRRLAPSKPYWVNLLPTYARIFPTFDDYDHYIKSYIDIVKPMMLTYDHYPFVGDDPLV